MLELRIAIEVYCNTCGAGLCRTVDITYDNSGCAEIHVPACRYCLAEAEEIGRAGGFQAGYDEAVNTLTKEN